VASVRVQTTVDRLARQPTVRSPPRSRQLRATSLLCRLLVNLRFEADSGSKPAHLREGRIRIGRAYVRSGIVRGINQLLTRVVEAIASPTALRGAGNANL